MPRPPQLGAYKIVGFAIEIEYYNMLRELAFEKGLTVSELLRRIVYEYLEKLGLRRAEVVAQDGSIITLSKLEQKRLAIEFNKSLYQCMEIVNSIRNMEKTYGSRIGNTLSLHSKVAELDEKIKYMMTLLQRLGVPSDNKVKQINEILEFRKELQEKYKI